MKGQLLSSVERWLPIFPLNTVLFPNATLPVQIFEDRYKQMLRDCMEADSRFGVVLIQEGTEVGGPATPYTVGTVAHIVQSNEVRGGRYFLSVMGASRFQIKEITQHQPYMAAQVTLLEDDKEAWVPDTEMKAIREALTSYVRLAAGLRGGWVRESGVSSDPVALSYSIASMLQVQLPEKQALLEEGSAAKRLEIELDLLRRELEPLKRRVSQELRRKFGRQ